MPLLSPKFAAVPKEESVFGRPELTEALTLNRVASGMAQEESVVSAGDDKRSGYGPTKIASTLLSSLEHFHGSVVVLKNHDLFVAQGDHWVYARSAARGHVRGEPRNRAQQYRDGNEDNRVPRLHTID